MDSNSVHTRLIELKEAIGSKKRAEAALSKARELLEQERELLRRQDLIVNKEYEDVLRLEGNSLSSIFHSFLANRVEKLDEEREEYLAAKLKHEGCKETAAHIEEEVQRQEKEVQALGDPESAYSELIRSRKEELRAKNDPKYLIVSGRMDAAYAKIVEIEEANSAGEKASKALSNAIESMQKAENWGTVDMLGGGLIMTMIKHSHIDTARSQIQGIQSILKMFQRELQDVQSMDNVNLTVDIGGFDKVMDMFFDNLIFDWVVQKRIQRSLDSLIATRMRINKILLDLKKEAAALREEYQSLKKQETDYLESV